MDGTPHTGPGPVPERGEGNTPPGRGQAPPGAGVPDLPGAGVPDPPGAGVPDLPGRWPPGPPAGRKHDPLAAALGNASLLGIGYLLLGRRWLALAQVGCALIILSLLHAFAEVWCEFLVLGWWLLTIAHGWFLARHGTRRVTSPAQRLVALGAALAVLLPVGWLRFDAAQIQQDVTDARERGDCKAALAAQDEVGFGHRVADAPGAERGDATADACRRLHRASEELATGLTGDTDALATGFDTLAAVLKQRGHTNTVDATLSGFLDRLPVDDPCDTAKVTDWLRRRDTSHDVLDRTADTVKRVAPGALVGCADQHRASDEWRQARTRYRQLLDQYPGSALRGRARTGAHKATLAIELATVRSRLTQTADEQPEYCTKPAKYSAAAPVRKGTVNRALFYGNAEFTDQLPKRWRASDAAKAVLVVCVDEAEADETGTAVQTCPYEHKLAIGGVSDVTFHKIAVPVKVYSVRTGKVVADRTVEIGGASCPQWLEYETYFTDAGPPSDVLVEESKADVRAAFSPLINNE